MTRCPARLDRADHAAPRTERESAPFGPRRRFAKTNVNPNVNLMELDVSGSVAWYVAMLVAGLVTGVVVAWLRRGKKRED